MNIWLINHYAVPPSLYPLARTTYFAKHLMKAGHSVTVFAASMVHNSEINLINDKSPYHEETVEGVHYVYVRTCFYKGNGIRRIINMFQFAKRLPKVCRLFENPDAILASTATPPACMAGINLSKKYRCRGIAEVSDLWPESFVAYGLIRKQNPLLFLMYQYEKKIYEKADAIIFTMEGGIDYIIKKGWDKSTKLIDLKKVFHINNGVDIEEYEYNRSRYVISDPDLNSEYTFKVVYTGSIREANSLGTIVDAVEILHNRAENHIRFFIYGDGCDRESLSDKCLQKGLNNIVFKGSVDKKYIPSILSKSDLNLFHVNETPILKFGVSPNKLFEYFAAGKPILSDVKAGYDLIEKYKAGIVLGSQLPQIIADSILEFAQMPAEIYGEYSANAKNAALDYDFKTLTLKLLSILKE